MPDTALILLAAGGSSRMGTPKQLLVYKGKPLIRHAAETALQSLCRPVIVVIGSQGDQIQRVLEDLPVTIVENPDWQSGMGSSIHAGVKAVDARDCSGLILTLADQPLVSAEILNRLVATNRASGQPIVASQYAGTVGVPVYFSQDFFASLLALPADQGCKGLILNNAGKSIRLDCPEAEFDVDTPDDFSTLTATYPE